jgi:hypothetical protein
VRKHVGSGKDQKVSQLVTNTALFPGKSQEKLELDKSLPCIYYLDQIPSQRCAGEKPDSVFTGNTGSCHDGATFDIVRARSQNAISFPRSKCRGIGAYEHDSTLSFILTTSSCIQHNSQPHPTSDITSHIRFLAFSSLKPLDQEHLSR